MLFATAAKFPLIRDPNSAKSFVSRLGKATAASHRPRFNCHSTTGISRTSLASFKFAAISDGTLTRTTGAILSKKRIIRALDTSGSNCFANWNFDYAVHQHVSRLLCRRLSSTRKTHSDVYFANRDQIVR